MSYSNYKNQLKNDWIESAKKLKNKIMNILQPSKWMVVFRADGIITVIDCKEEFYAWTLRGAHKRARKMVHGTNYTLRKMETA